MAITKMRFRQFTAFEELDFIAYPGINVLVGANGTGKTHLMKVAYAACDISKTKIDFAEKLVRVFMPSFQHLGRLVRRQQTSSHDEEGLQDPIECHVEVRRDDTLSIDAFFFNYEMSSGDAEVLYAKEWCDRPVESVYIPVKEMLANAPGFRSLYAQREIHFEEIYADILDRAYLPPLRDPMDRDYRLLVDLRQIIGGEVTTRGEEFFLISEQGSLEFTLLAEGMRKLGLLWRLIRNGAMSKGSILFWDEPETNLNPKLFGPLVEILLELQRMGVQIFIATHDYVILKELDLRMNSQDQIAFHSLYRHPENDQIHLHTTEAYLAIHPNAIAQAFDSLYDREIERSMRGEDQ